MTRKELEKLILQDKMSYESIGKLLGVTGSAIKKRAIKMGINLQPKRAINPKENFSHPRNQHFSICPICGREFRTRGNNKKQITCSIKCGGIYRGQMKKKKNQENLKQKEWDGIEKKNMWTPLFLIKSNGYLWAKCPNHPNAFKDGYVLAHRIVVENNIGRLLRKNEVVHHKDGNKTNNDISNLEILSLSEHSKHHYYEREQKGVGVHSFYRDVAKGKKTRCGRFDENEIRYIRMSFSNKQKTCKELAIEFNVKNITISQIINNKTYRWVY